MKNSAKTRPVPRLFWLLVFVAVALVLTMAFFQVRRARTSNGDVLDRYGAAPEFQLLDQQGKNVSLGDLKGTIWVADFIFTRCQGPCPIITARMAQLSDALKGDHPVKLISVTVDPDHDVPAVLAEYAKNVRADPQRWIFLTGAKDEVEAFMVKGLLQPIIHNPQSGLIHSTQLVVVDPSGQIRAFRDGTDPRVVAQVLTDIRSLEREFGSNR